MRISVKFPAIVSRRDSGKTAASHALVKTTATFEIEEFSSKTVQTAAIITDNFEQTFIRKIGPHFYRSMNGLRSNDLADGSDFMRRLIVDERAFDFSTFMTAIVRASEPLFREGNGQNRPVTYLDISSTKTRSSKSFDKAPDVERQPWLGAGVESDIEKWADLFQIHLENVVLIDDAIHVRCFEPCYCLTIHRGVRKLDVGSMSFMEKSLGQPILIPGESQADMRLGQGGNTIDRHYFSLLERDMALWLADEFDVTEDFGRGALSPAVTIVDASALSPDFVHAENYRLAVNTLIASDEVLNSIAEFGYADAEDRKVLARKLALISVPANVLKTLIEERDDYDGIAVETATKILIDSISSHSTQMMTKIALLARAQDFLDIRRDARPIDIAGVISNHNLGR